jgi:hypothetical protein
MILKLVALALLIGMMGGLLYLFLRSGIKIKPGTQTGKTKIGLTSRWAVHRIFRDYSLPHPR